MAKSPFWIATTRLVLQMHDQHIHTHTHTNIQKVAPLHMYPLQRYMYNQNMNKLVSSDVWHNDKIHVFVKQYAPTATKSEKAIFSPKVKVKVIEIGVIGKGIIIWVCKPNMKSLPLAVQNLQQMLKLTTDKQTNRTKTKCPQYIWGHDKTHGYQIRGQEALTHAGDHNHTKSS